MKRYTLAVLVFATVFFALPALSQGKAGAHPAPIPDYSSFYLNLRTGQFVSLGLAVPPGVSVPTFNLLPPNPNCPGDWYEAHVNINLDPHDPNKPARTAHITVEYEGTPAGWTVDIGDSPTDNGYGGNNGTSEKAAEVQVVDQLLSVFDDNTGVYGQVDNLLRQQESLTNGSLKFTITDQTLTVGQPSSVLATPVTKLLYTLPDPADPNGPYYIYAAFNAVIYPTSGRTGCGARSAVISTVQ